MYILYYDIQTKLLNAQEICYYHVRKSANKLNQGKRYYHTGELWVSKTWYWWYC